MTPELMSGTLTITGGTNPVTQSIPPVLWPPCADPGYVAGIRAFVRDEILPVADAIDADDVYPVEIIRRLGRAGYNTNALPEAYGGAGRSYATSVALFEEVGVASAAVGVSLLTIFQAQTMIALFAEESLKARYLPRFADGLLASYALTEVSHGSDIRTLDTKAHRDGDAWVLQGEKSFITSGSAAEFFVILAETETGVSVFAVPGEVPNLSTYEGRNSATFGLRNGPHVNLRLDGARVPLDHLIGQEGKGVRQAVTTLDYSRTLAAAISVGIARAAFEGALAHARGRTAFDQKVLDFQGIQWYFAEMLTEIDAARLLTYRAAQALDAHDDIARYSSEAKLKASAVATDVAGRAVQICGAYGTMINAPFGRYLRDAKTYEIGGGSSEILKNTIGRYLSRGTFG
jgi:alkylation response protein AidB-like acyl-CoA dehydrogenase